MPSLLLYGHVCMYSGHKASRSLYMALLVLMFSVQLLLMYITQQTVLMTCSLFPLSKCVMITQLIHTVVVPLIITLPCNYNYMPC